MRKKAVVITATAIFAVFITMCVLLIFCNPYNSRDKRIDLFNRVLTDLIEYDAELNRNMQYIGVEIRDQELPDEDISRILSHIEDEYSVKTIVYSSQQKNDGMRGSNRYKVLHLSIKVIKVKPSYIYVICSKGGAEFGAAGYWAYYKYKDGSWMLIKRENGWLS